MKSFNRSKIYLIFILFTFIYSVQVFSCIYTDSLTNDEPAEITNGYYYLTQGDVITPHLHPPLASALTALPLLALHLKTLPASGDVIDRAHSFMFEWNLDKLSTITALTRLVSWLFGLFIGVLLFFITRDSLPLCAAALFFWAFNPTMLALSGIAKIEIIPAFLFFLGIFIFQKTLEKSNSGWFFLSGVITAMAVTSKLYCLTLIPIFLVIEWAGRKNLKNGFVLKRWSWGLAGFFVLVFCLYLPALIFLPNHAEVFSSLVEKLREDFVFASHPFPVYLLGRCTLENHWYYLPIAFVLKEPLSFIFALVLTAGLALSRQIRLSLWQWFPAVLFFLAVLPTTNLGIRYLLPAYPFLFLIAAQGVLWLWQAGKQKVFFVWVLVGLVLWQTVSVGLGFSHSLSYFNELVPSNRKLYYLGDSNLDWGQDLKRLAATARERHWGKVKLAYLGAVDPQVYGLDWEPFQVEDLQKPQPGTIYAVNASFYQLAPVAYPSTLPLVEGWLNKTEPTGKVGDSWYYFEVPGERLVAKNTSWLPSAPFLQYRGYCSYPVSRPQ